MRIATLDSLRGLAAVSVMLYHCLLVYPDLYRFLGGRGTSVHVLPELPVLLMTITPLHLLWSGREAVLLFFVLSGFVLSLPFFAASPPAYAPFVIKRFCRLFPPLGFAVILAALAAMLVTPQPKPELSDWFNSSWREEVSLSLVLSHALLLEGAYPLNNVLWSLFHEWRISLIFPLLVLALQRSLILALGATALGLGAWYAERVLLGSDYLDMVHYAIFFVLGAGLARHRAAIVGCLQGCSATHRVCLWVACYALSHYRWIAPDSAALLSYEFANLAGYADAMIADVMNGLGAALLIALCLSSRRAEVLLCRPALLWLGRISYSLYLLHVPVILGAVHLLDGHLPLALILALVPAFSLATAHGMFKLVEQPSMRLGRHLSHAASLSSVYRRRRWTGLRGWTVGGRATPGARSARLAAGRGLSSPSPATDQPRNVVPRRVRDADCRSRSAG